MVFLPSLIYLSSVGDSGSKETEESELKGASDGSELCGMHLSFVTTCSLCVHGREDLVLVENLCAGLSNCRRNKPR